MNSTRSAPFARRILPAALLLLQVAIAAILPLAEARLDRAAPQAAVHVESGDRPPCPAGHDHLECQFCRHIGGNLLAGVGVLRVIPATLVAAATIPSSGILSSGGDHLDSARPRAPPIA